MKNHFSSKSLKVNKNQLNLTEGFVFFQLIKFAIPLILSSVLQLVFNAADIIVVGKFAGDNALAAVGSTSSLINLLVNLFVGLSVGTNVVVANFFGAGRKRELSTTVHTAILLSFISGGILTIIGVIGTKYILILMQTPKEVLSLATIYLRVYFGGIIATVVFNFGSAILRAKGDTKRPLYILILAGVVNVCLNLVFVIFFKMSVAGVALATVISQFLSAFLVINCLLKEEPDFRLNLRKLNLDKDIFIKIVRIGVPAGLQGIIFSLSNVVIQSSINSFGSVIVAGSSAASNIEGFTFTAMNGFTQGTLTFVSQNLGAKKIDRIKKVVLISLSSVFVVGTVLGVMSVIFGKNLLKFYTDNPDVINAGLLRLKFVCTFYALCGMMDVMGSSIRGLGHSVLPMIVSLAGACGFRLLWLATIFTIPSYHTCETIFISYPFSWLITFVVHIICFVIIMKKTN